MITKMPEIKDPMSTKASTALMRLHPGGTEEIIVQGDHGAEMGTVVSLDGE